MQNTETLDNKIKLLSEYIEALQKQMVAHKNESEELQKLYSESDGNLSRAELALERANHENRELQRAISGLEREVAPLFQVRQEYFSIREAMDVQLAAKESLFDRIQQIANNNRRLYDSNTDLARELEAQWLMLGEERQQGLSISSKNKLLQQQKEELVEEKIQLKQLIDAKVIEIAALTHALSSLNSNHQNYIGNEKEQKQHLIKVINEMQRSKESMELFYRTELNKKSASINQINDELQETAHLLKNKEIQIANFKEEFNKSYSSLNQNPQNIVKENNEILQKNSLLELQIKQLQNKYQELQKGIALSKVRLEQMQQSHNISKNELKCQYESQLLGKEEKLAQSYKQKISLQENIHNYQFLVNQLKIQLTNKQKNLKDSIRNVELELDDQIQQLRLLHLSSSLKNGYKLCNQQTLQYFKQSLQLLENAMNEQKVQIEWLNGYIKQKQNEIEALQSSNAILRKLLMNSISSEESSKKQLMNYRSKNSSISTQSRTKTVRLSSMDSFIKQLDHEQKSQRMNKIFANHSIISQICFKKMTPSQSRIKDEMEVSIKDISE